MIRKIARIFMVLCIGAAMTGSVMAADLFNKRNDFPDSTGIFIPHNDFKSKVFDWFHWRKKPADKTAAKAGTFDPRLMGVAGPDPTSQAELIQVATAWRAPVLADMDTMRAAVQTRVEQAAARRQQQAAQAALLAPRTPAVQTKGHLLEVDIYDESGKLLKEDKAKAQAAPTIPYTTRGGGKTKEDTGPKTPRRIFNDPRLNQR